MAEAQPISGLLYKARQLELSFLLLAAECILIITTVVKTVLPELISIGGK